MARDRGRSPGAVAKAHQGTGRIKEQVLRGLLRGESQESQVEMLRRRYHRLETDILATEPADVLEPYLASFAHAFDPHSDYFKPSTNADFDIEMSNSLEGIGATLRTEGEYTLVYSLVPGGPAQQGEELQPGDRIVAVAQGSEPPVDVVDERIDKVVKQIRGPKGTEVRLTVIPVDAPDPSHTRVIRITRDQVILAADDAESRVIEVPGQDGQGIKLGLIDIPSFYQDFQARRGGDPEFKSTTRDVKQLLTELKAEEVSGIILDVRRNGGGSLNESVELTGLFIPQGPVVQIGDRSGRTEAMYDPDPAVVYDGPLMVLTSPLSASASEILAGAIQDYDRGLVVGSASTHGKGTVQNVIDLDPVLRRFVRYPTPDDLAGAVKVTTHKFYRVSGASTQLRGVQADVVLPSPFDGLELLEGDLDYVLGWDRVAPLTYREI
ncbi:MAG: PDZ domain-containing protein, partial [Deltaproteobacteria bacterium]|nr:PDZ domain-containing protein [Deltaproteobacteria bacterium]